MFRNPTIPKRVPRAAGVSIQNPRSSSGMHDRFGRVSFEVAV